MDAATWANCIAGVAFTVSVFAAVFAWKSAREAKLANRISLHGYQKELLQEFLGIYRVLQSRGVNTSSSAVSLFGPHAKSARLYVSVNLAKEIEEFYNSCIQIEHLKGNLETAKSQCSFIAQQPINIHPNERATADQKSSADADLADSRRKLIECVDLAKKLGGKIDNALVDEIKIV